MIDPNVTARLQRARERRPSAVATAAATLATITGTS